MKLNTNKSGMTYWSLSKVLVKKFNQKIYRLEHVHFNKQVKDKLLYLGISFISVFPHYIKKHYMSAQVAYVKNKIKI